MGRGSLRDSATESSAAAGEILSKNGVGRTRSGSCRCVVSTARDQASRPQPTVVGPAPRAASSSGGSQVP